MKSWIVAGADTVGTSERWAVLSPCRRFRYVLGRCWDPELPTLAVTMLNPSKADHEVNDRTIAKCVRFAGMEGCGSLLVRNCSAFRATDPKALNGEPLICGDLNLAVLARETDALMHVAAWGGRGKLTQRTWQRLAEARYVARATHVFGLTKDGHPRHPLYLPYATRAKSWRAA